MNTILEFVKNYFIFLLVLYLFTYLAPQENYRKYFRFFVSALMIAVLLQPVLHLLNQDGQAQTKEQLDTIWSQLENNQYEGKGEDVFEWFWEREGVDWEEIKNQE